MWRKGRIATDSHLTSTLQFSYDEQQVLAIAAFIYLFFVQFNTLHLFTRLSSFNDDFNSSNITNDLFNNVFSSSGNLVSNGEYRIRRGRGVTRDISLERLSKHRKFLIRSVCLLAEI